MRLFAQLGVFCALGLVPATSQANPVVDPSGMIDTDGDGVIDPEDACPQDPGPAEDDEKKSGCTPKAQAIKWIVTFIARNAPPGRPTYFKHAVETKDEALARYRGIAESLIEVVYDPQTVPLFRGPVGRARTIAIMLGVSFWETGFRRDVDLGLGPHGRGDQGRSWCLMQLNVGKGKSPGGFSGPELVADRTHCFSEGLRAIRGSFAACRGLGLEYRLSAYASGTCAKGRDKSRQRVGTGMSWFANSRDIRLFTDADVLEELNPPAPEPVFGPALAWNF